MWNQFYTSFSYQKLNHERKRAFNFGKTNESKIVIISENVVLWLSYIISQTFCVINSVQTKRSSLNRGGVDTAADALTVAHGKGKSQNSLAQFRVWNIAFTVIHNIEYRKPQLENRKGNNCNKVIVDKKREKKERKTERKKRKKRVMTE